MNNKQLYLAWVRTTAPQVYSQALQRVLNSRAGMSGLGDDLTDSITGQGSVFDPNSVSGLSDSDAANLASAASQAASSSSSWSDLFDSIASAVGSIAPVIVQTQAQQNLLAINTQRAQQGLPPLANVNGTIVAASQLAPANPTLAQLESSLSGGSGLLLLGGVGLLAVLLLSRGGARHA